jgi:hypothetical protein
VEGVVEVAQVAQESQKLLIEFLAAWVAAALESLNASEVAEGEIFSEKKCLLQQYQ